MINTIPLTYYHAAKRRKRQRITALIKKFVLACLLGAMIAGGSVGFMILLLNAADKEAGWRQERLCRIYEICDPKAGP